MRRRETAWGGLVALVLACAVVGLLAQLTPEHVPNRSWVSPDRDGIARTSAFEASVARVRAGEQLKGDSEELYRSQGEFVVVTVEISPTRRGLSFLELGVRTRDGFRYDRLQWPGLSDGGNLYTGYRYTVDIAFEVPRDKRDGLVLEVGPEIQNGVQSLRDGARFDLPDDRERVTTPISLSEMKDEAVR